MSPFQNMLNPSTLQNKLREGIHPPIPGGFPDRAPHSPRERPVVKPLDVLSGSVSLFTSFQEKHAGLASPTGLASDRLSNGPYSKSKLC